MWNMGYVCKKDGLDRYLLRASKCLVFCGKIIDFPFIGPVPPSSFSPLNDRVQVEIEI